MITDWLISYLSGRPLWISRQSIAIKKWRHMGHVWPPTHPHGSKSAMNWRWRLQSVHHRSKALYTHIHYDSTLTSLTTHICKDVGICMFVSLAQWSRRSDRTVPSSLWSLNAVWAKTRTNLPPARHTWLALLLVQRQWTSVEWVSACRDWPYTTQGHIQTVVIKFNRWGHALYCLPGKQGDVCLCNCLFRLGKADYGPGHLYNVWYNTHYKWNHWLSCLQNRSRGKNRSK